jgi:hypothetical protein
VRGRPHPRYLDATSSSFPDHVRRHEYALGGIDYGPVGINEDSYICPVAAGFVIGTHDHAPSAGMFLTIAHGLGWKTQYAHLQARFVGFRDRVERRDIVAVMGASGQGATRGGVGVARHLHLTLWGPAWSPLFAGASRQDHAKSPSGWRYVLDPEEFSLGGRNTYLPYSRAEDAPVHDTAFAAVHEEAVRVADDLLDRMRDMDAIRVKRRKEFEEQMQFDYDVDQRIWFLWQRLDGGPHPFAPDEAHAHRATLLRFMRAVPRFTAPIVEPARRTEYRVHREQPVKTFEGRPL